MTQQKQGVLTNWLLGLSTTIATAGFGVAWNTNAKMSVLLDHDGQHTATESRLNQKSDDLQIGQYDIKNRLTHLEDKIKTK